jgi:S-adenosylhomocysteine hydrolase
VAGKSKYPLNPPKLPLLDILPSLENNVDFSNTILVGVQHLQASNASLLVKLHEAGLDYKRMCLLGKVYSSSPLVVEILQRLGVFVHKGSLELTDIGLVENYRKQLGKAAANLLVRANKLLRAQPKPRTLLVVDSGASLITLVNRYREGIDAEVVAVEQTTDGARRIRELSNVLFPIIDVAESHAKRRHESPYIASSIIKNLDIRIRALPIETKLTNLDALVVGIGAVGMQVARQLRNKVASVAVYDVTKERLDLASNEGLHVVGLRDGLSWNQIIIGCVGKNWLPEDGEQLIQDGAILASGSSSNVEFLGMNVLNKHEVTGLELAHRDYLVKVQNGKAWVLNAGFPIDFDGSPDPIPPEVIQFTRALMLAGIYQAMESDQANRGLVRLDEGVQDYQIEAASNFNVI